jgi:predicted CXXCH cytochrome family protein
MDATRAMKTDEGRMSMKALRRSAALAVLLTGAWVFLQVPSAFAFVGSYVPGVGINGTPHDLGTAHNGMNYTAVPADPQHRICIFCHAPHNTYRLATVAGGTGPQANAAFDYLPLWNHTLPATIQQYIMYDPGPGAPQVGPHATQAIEAGMTPGSTSLLCLSCHDGSIAVNSWGNPFQPSQSTGTTFMAAAYQIGATGNLTNHHPIGFNYFTVQAGDTEIRDPSTAMLTSNSFVVDHLYGENLECGSCHSVHNKGNTGEKLLWRSDQNSELCLTCHDKGIYTPPPA